MMTLHIVPTSPRTNNLKSNLRSLMLRLVLWLLNKYAPQGFYLDVHGEKPIIHQDGQPYTPTPLPPPTQAQRKALRNRLFV
jgi:hypothetical protein